MEAAGGEEEEGGWGGGLEDSCSAPYPDPAVVSRGVGVVEHEGEPSDVEAAASAPNVAWCCDDRRWPAGVFGAEVCGVRCCCSSAALAPLDMGRICMESVCSWEALESSSGVLSRASIWTGGRESVRSREVRGNERVARSREVRGNPHSPTHPSHSHPLTSHTPIHPLPHTPIHPLTSHTPIHPPPLHPSLLPHRPLPPPLPPHLPATHTTLFSQTPAPLFSPAMAGASPRPGW